MLMARFASSQELVVLQGTLQGGMVGIGGEHSGFVLDGVSIEVDLSSVEEAGDLAGQTVRLQGRFEVKPYLERGATPVFRVSAAKLATDRSPFPVPRDPSAKGSVRSREEMRADALKLLQYDEGFRDEVRRLLAGEDGAAPH
jgi:hypothetical protein